MVWNLALSVLTHNHARSESRSFGTVVQNHVISNSLSSGVFKWCMISISIVLKKCDNTPVRGIIHPGLGKILQANQEKFQGGQTT